MAAQAETRLPWFVGWSPITIWFTFFSLVTWLIPHGSQEQNISFANIPNPWLNLQKMVEKKKMKDEIIMVDVNFSAAMKWLLRHELQCPVWTTKRNRLESPILPQTASSCHSISRAANTDSVSWQFSRGQISHSRQWAAVTERQEKGMTQQACVWNVISHSQRLFVGF